MGSDMFLYRLTVSFLTIQIYFSFDNNCKIFVYTICIYEMLDVESRPVDSHNGALEIILVGPSIEWCLGRGLSPENYCSYST